MGESLTSCFAVFHIKALGLSENHSNRSYISRFSEIIRSGIKTNSWHPRLKREPSSVQSGCRSIRLTKFVVPKVSTVEFQSVTGRESSRWEDEEKEILDDVSKPAIVSENRPQFLEERDEKKLSWRLLKLSRKDKVKGAMKLFASMEFIGLRPNPHACNALLSCLLRNARLDDAFKTFEVMKANAMTSEHSYNLILQGVAKARGFDASFEMFEELIANEDHKMLFDVVLYNNMITLCREAKDWLKCERIWRRMKENGQIGNSLTYRLLVTMFLDLCQYDLAIEAYHEMLQNGVEPDMGTLEAVLMAFVKDGKWDFALGVFRDMINRNEKPNDIVFNALIHSLGNNGQVNLAFKVYSFMKSLGHVPSAYTWNALMIALCRGKRYGDALRLFERIQQDKSCVVALHLYNTALMACQKLGFWRRALQIVWEMEELGLSIPVTSYNRVIGACEVGKEPKVALQVYQHMVHQEKCPDTFTLLSMLRACIWGSLWDEVYEILKLVPPNAHLYNAAIQGLCLRQKISSATKLYHEMRKLGLVPDGKTWAMMLRHLPKS